MAEVASSEVSVAVHMAVGSFKELPFGLEFDREPGFRQEETRFLQFCAMSEQFRGVPCNVPSGERF